MSNNKTFSFGTPASSAPSSGGLFGSNQGGSGGSTGGELFGNIGAPSSGTSSPSMFGTANTGQKPSIFGSGNTGAGSSTTPTFNFGTQNQANSTTPSSTSLFGGTTQTPNRTTEAAAPAQTKTSGLLGNNAATPAPNGGSSLFNTASTTPAGPPPSGTSTSQGQSLFGGQGAQKSPFGSNTPSTVPAAPSQSQQSGGIFGQGGGAKPLFGTTPSAPTGSSLFGAPSTDKLPGGDQKIPATLDSGSKSLFGAASTAASTGNTPAMLTSSPFKPSYAGPDPQSGSKSLFPGLGTAASQPSTSASSTATPQKSLFPGLGNTISSTTPSSTPAAAAAGGSLFSRIGAPQSTVAGSSATTITTAAPAQTASSTGNMFSLRKPADSKPVSTTAGAIPSTTAPATTTSGTSTATSATAPATTATISDATGKPAVGAPGLGASTIGPAPPAHSRLKNKTMDEIITRWATDLTKYQKEFREQAEKVAKWDRMLVENGTKVQKLYGNTVDADRATQEVERQLASVEGQQEELNSWLDRYEREVDEMLSKQVGPGETLQGPDQERERTYRLAEKLSERLDEMGKDLSSMIEEVNSASSTLSKTNKADEPISQIVRILNSHLSQLQVIDQGTAELQAKISAVQKAGQTLGSRLSGYGYNGVGGSNSIGVGGSAVDDFYRSYMGRR